MNITLHQSRVKSLNRSDPDFFIDDGFVRYPRAMVHLLPECPHNVRDMVNFAIAKGYLQCVAHMVDYEYTMDKLKETV